MATYSIEDVEIIRRKSGISYQEAVALLEYHNGNLTQALIDLERNGKLKKETETTKASGSKKNGFWNFLGKLYRERIKISKDGMPIMNISVLLAAAALLTAPWLAIGILICFLVLGYRFAYTHDDPDFAQDNLEKMVRNAAENVKASARDVAGQFTDKTAKPAQTSSADTASSYYDKPAAEPIHSAPTIQVPVQVDSPDGTMDIENDLNGYSSATIHE